MRIEGSKRIHITASKISHNVVSAKTLDETNGANPIGSPTNIPR
jgi:hypothetical protein